MTPQPESVSPWHDGFVLGYAPMDHVHEEFVTLVDELRHAADEDMASALQAVADHCVEHFETENAWMAETGFPARQCHVDEHAAVLSSIQGVQRRVEQGDCAAATRLAVALADWFPGHADYLDAALAHWMCKLRLGGKPLVLRRHIDTPMPATAS